MRVLICGSRDWVEEEPIRRFVGGLASFTVVIHGAAPGADTMAKGMAKARGLSVEDFPADWKRYGKAAGPIRNRQMLDEGKPDFVAAFIRDLATTRGTKDMLIRAWRVGLPTVIYLAGKGWLSPGKRAALRKRWDKQRR